MFTLFSLFVAWILLGAAILVPFVLIITNRPGWNISVNSRGDRLINTVAEFYRATLMLGYFTPRDWAFAATLFTFWPVVLGVYVLDKLVPLIPLNDPAPEETVDYTEGGEW